MKALFYANTVQDIMFELEFEALVDIVLHIEMYEKKCPDEEYDKLSVVYDDTTGIYELTLLFKKRTR